MGRERRTLERASSFSVVFRLEPFSIFAVIVTGLHKGDRKGDLKAASCCEYN